MVSLNVKLDLPETLARKAQEAGLLTSQAIGAMLEREMDRRQAAERMVENMERLAASKEPPLTPMELDAEIAAARAERRARDARRP